MIAARRVALAAAAVIFAYLALAALGAIVPGPTADIASGSDTEILLIAGPIHYDILLPATEPTRAAFGFAARAGVQIDDPAVAWIVVGWGSRAFYTTVGDYRDVRPAAIWRAVTGDSGVLRVDIAGRLRDDLPVIRIPVSNAQLDALRNAIVGEVTGPALPHPGLTRSDLFFPAKDTFSILNTCNVWVSRILRRAGIGMGVWTPTPYAVTISAKLRH